MWFPRLSWKDYEADLERNLRRFAQPGPKWSISGAAKPANHRRSSTLRITVIHYFERSRGSELSKACRSLKRLIQERFRAFLLKQLGGTKECVMPLIANFLAIFSLLVAFTIGVAPTAARAEQRLALVLGNSAYEAGALKTAANDAGLVAQTLEAAGFDVMGARDLDQDALRRAFRDFVKKAGALGSDDVAVVYLSGYGLQLDGENYFVPVDGRIERASDVPVQAIRLSDYTRALAALKLKASILVLDVARNHPFTFKGEPLAGGLALVEPDPGMLVAFNAAPGTIAPEAEGAYGPYAKALAEMMREGGLPLDDLFDRVRLRASDVTQGAQVPWHASNVAASFVFFERTADAPPSVAAREVTPALRSRAIRNLGAQEAYVAALERDTLPGYLEFLDNYPTDPLANRVRAIVAARREALIWRRTRSVDTSVAYWAYLRLYSEGPHAGDCHRRLAILHSSLEPPPEISDVDYDISPPAPEESTYLQQPVIFFGDPKYDFPLPPPIPESFLPVPSPEFTELPPPELPETPFVLPTPVYIPVPASVRPPHYVQPPSASNVIFANLHNKVVPNRAAKTFTVTDREGHTRTLPPAPAFQDGNQEGRHPGAQRRQVAASDRNLGPALPPSLALAELASGREGSTNQPHREGLDRAQREKGWGLPLPGATEQRSLGAPGGSAGTIRRFSSQPPRPQSNPFWGDREQRHVPGPAVGSPQPTLPLTQPREPLPKGATAPVVPRTATTTTPPVSHVPAESGQGPGRARPQPPGAGAAPPSALLPPAQSRTRAGQPVPQAPAARPERPSQPTQAVREIAAPSGSQVAPTGQSQQLDRQRAERQQQQAQQRAQQEQAAAARQQRQGAEAARGPQQQAAQQAPAARAQQQATQQAAAARAQQQAAQQAAAARAQQQAAQQAAAARAQQQAAQQAAAARAQQQAAQQATAARAQQQAAQAAQAASAARASAAVAAARAQHVPAQRR
jgi:uncharacterized caspase-like protein